jgi:hypothetical protein
MQANFVMLIIDIYLFYLCKMIFMKFFKKGLSYGWQHIFKIENLIFMKLKKKSFSYGLVKKNVYVAYFQN